MLLYVAVFALLGMTLADDCCSSEDRKEMLAMWSDVWSAEYTGRRVQVAQAVFDDLFHRDPEARHLFERVNVDNEDSPEFRAHCIRVVNGLDTVIGLLEDPDTLVEQLEHLGHQHHERKGVLKAHFTEIAHAFDHVMPQVSTCFNAGAWDRCMEGITNKIASYLDE